MASSQHLPSGTILMGGKYKVGHILGQGTFGITYMAVTKMVMTGNLGTGELEVPVAIKEFFLHDFNRRETSTPNVSGTDSELFTVYRRKFRKEALHITELSHPGIIRVFDVFDENGTTYYAMEFVDGENLDDYISRKGSLPVEEAVETMTEIGAALDYMHSKKMLHLDIKPRNIMRKSDGTFRLIDFGLSKSFDGTGFSESSSNIGLGTPGYAPIEQSAGRKDDSFPVTMDVYALGATLFKMLTGERPPVSTEILNDGLPEEALKEKGIPTEIIDVVRKAMSPTVGQRYQSVSALLADLQKARYSHAELDGNEVEVVDVDMPIPGTTTDYKEPQRILIPKPTETRKQNTDKQTGIELETTITEPAEITQNDITYSLDWPNKTATVKIASEDIKIANIPAEINCNGINFKVKKIGNVAFFECSKLTSVTIPDSVTKIGTMAFWDCNNLTSVSIPNSVTEIGQWAFEGCRNLKSVTIPDSVTEIGNAAFAECTNLTWLTIPNSVTKIGDYAFAYCPSLTGLMIPNSVTEIGSYAFLNCSNLIVSYTSGAKIGYGAFSGCRSAKPR